MIVTVFFTILCIGLGFKIVLLRATIIDLRVVTQSGTNGVRKILARAAVRRVRAWLLVFIALIVQLSPRVFFDTPASVPMVFFVFLVLVSVMLTETYAEYQYRRTVRDFILERLK